MFKGITKLGKKSGYEELKSSIHIVSMGYEALVLVTYNTPVKDLENLDPQPIMEKIEQRYLELDKEDQKGLLIALDALGVDYERSATVKITNY